MYKQFGINEEVIELAHKTEEQVKEQVSVADDSDIDSLFS